MEEIFFIYFLSFSDNNAQRMFRLPWSVFRVEQKIGGKIESVIYILNGIAFRISGIKSWNITSSQMSSSFRSPPSDHFVRLLLHAFYHFPAQMDPNGSMNFLHIRQSIFISSSFLLFYFFVIFSSQILFNEKILWNR